MIVDSKHDAVSVEFADDVQGLPNMCKKQPAQIWPNARAHSGNRATGTNLQSAPAPLKSGTILEATARHRFGKNAPVQIKPTDNEPRHGLEPGNKAPGQT